MVISNYQQQKYQNLKKDKITTSTTRISQMRLDSPEYQNALQDGVFDNMGFVNLKSLQSGGPIQAERLPVCLWHEYHQHVECRTSILPQLYQQKFIIFYPQDITNELKQYSSEYFEKLYWDKVWKNKNYYNGNMKVEMMKKIILKNNAKYHFLHQLKRIKLMHKLLFNN
eukprot:UN02165